MTNESGNGYTLVTGGAGFIATNLVRRLAESGQDVVVLDNFSRPGVERNAAWLQAHAAEVYTRYRGTCICVAGAALFVAETPEEVLTLATTAHPEDDGLFLRYIPRAKLARISTRAGGIQDGAFGRADQGRGKR